MASTRPAKNLSKKLMEEFGRRFELDSQLIHNVLHFFSNLKEVDDPIRLKEEMTQTLPPTFKLT